LRFISPNSIALLANYVTVVEGKPIMSVKYCQYCNPLCSAVSLR